MSMSQPVRPGTINPRVKWNFEWRNLQSGSLTIPRPYCGDERPIASCVTDPPAEGDQCLRSLCRNLCPCSGDLPFFGANTSSTPRTQPSGRENNATARRNAAVQAAAFGNRAYPHRWNFAWKTTAAGFEPKEIKSARPSLTAPTIQGPQISGVTYFTNPFPRPCTRDGRIILHMYFSSNLYPFSLSID